MTNSDMLPIAQALETAISRLYYGGHLGAAHPLRPGQP